MDAKPAPTDARTRETQKTPQQRGEEIAYTVNHALACTTLDVLNTPVEMLTQKYLGRKISVSYCPGCATGAHNEWFTAGHDTMGKRARRWIIAEIGGDWLGVIPTVAAQRFAPEAMEGLGRGLTYILGPAFRYGANRAARQWGVGQGLSPDAPEVKAHAQDIYTHEIRMLPFAGVWTVLSTAICLGLLKAQDDEYTLASNATAKLVGASTSILGVLGTRALAPEFARSADQWSSRNIFTPLTKIIGRTIGIDGQTVDRAVEKDPGHLAGHLL